MYMYYKDGPKFLLIENCTALHSHFYSLLTTTFCLRTAFHCTVDGTQWLPCTCHTVFSSLVQVSVKVCDCAGDFLQCGFAMWFSVQHRKRCLQCLLEGAGEGRCSPLAFSSWALPTWSTGSALGRRASLTSSPKILLEDQKDNQTFTKISLELLGTGFRELAASSYLPSVAVGTWLGRNPVGPSSCPCEQPPGAALSPLLPLAGLPASLWAWGWPWGSKAGEMARVSEVESLPCSH